MIAIFRALYADYISNPQYNVCLLGLESTGKTKYLNSLKYPQKNNEKVPYKPTVGFNVYKYSTGKGYLCMWDLGGKKSLRKIWEHYYPECHGLIYFMDQRIQEGINCLASILLHPDMIAIPIFIICSTSQVQSQIEKQLKKLEYDNFLAGHIVKFETYPINKIKTAEINKQVYKEIYQLDKKIKKNLI